VTIGFRLLIHLCPPLSAAMPIHAHTFFSLRYGTMPAEDALQRAAESGYDTMLLADINNTSTALDFVRLAPKHGVRPLLGVDFRNGAQRVFLAIARNNAGWEQICCLLSASFASGADIAQRAPVMSDVMVVYPFNTFSSEPFDLYVNEYVGVESRDINRWRFAEVARIPGKSLAAATFTFRDKRDFNAHRLLRAIDNNVLLSKLPSSEQAPETDRWIPRADLQESFAQFPELWANTQNLMDQCQIDFALGSGAPAQNKRTFTQSEDEDAALIARLCHESLPQRYTDASPAIIERLDKELSIIREKGYLAYFLIAHDLCAYARSRDFYYVGRGSGANSLAAYLLRITDVDPIELDLYFERFINLYRQNPPDFDLDFSWTDREEITQYLFDKYENVSLLAAYGTFQYRAVIRELGKVFGLTNDEMDVLASGKFNKADLDELSTLTLKYSTYIQDFPNLLSIHAGGVLITECPIEQFTATFMPPKGFPTAMFDMVVAEDAGIYKFDILSQRGLGKIKDTLELVKTNQPDADIEDIHNVSLFKQDLKVKEMLQSARAIGCFYVESPAMRMLLTKLRVEDYLGLVAASSIIRPGVARSGMMRQFIIRHRQPERRADAPAALLAIMPETYGVMVYQEDVIKVAHHFAGLDLGEADVLRRGMSGKFRSRDEFEKAREAFFEKAVLRGHAPDLVAEVWRQVESFAGYAFAKGHSASYAVESYQSLYLKAYFPIEYMTATLNNGGGFYSPELYVHEARLHGARISAPDANRSGALARVIGKEIILGFGMVKGLEHATIETLLGERQRSGTFDDLDDYISRCRPGCEQAVLLVRVGAFGFTGQMKKALLWRVYALLGHDKPPAVHPVLFKQPAKAIKIPQLEAHIIEDAYDELDLLGFPLCSPFDMLAEPLKAHTSARDLARMVGQSVVVAGYLITLKPTKTADGRYMYFGTLLDIHGEWLDTVHFPPAVAAQPFRGKGIYLIGGKAVEEFGALSVEVEWVQKQNLMPDPRLDSLRIGEGREKRARLER